MGKVGRGRTAASEKNKSHQLKGYHLLVDEKLGKSLYTELGNERQILSIPCFVIIDKTGKIVIRHAAAPSEPEKVIEQLSTYYNK